MSRFDEVCTTFGQSWDRMSQQINSLEAFLTMLLQGMCEYLGCKHEDISFFKDNSETIEFKKLIQAISFSLPCCQLGIEIKVHHLNSPLKQKGTLKIKIFIEKTLDSFILTLPPIGNQSQENKFSFHIGEINKSDVFQEFYESLFEQIKNFFENDYMWKLNSEPNSNQFGFRLDP